MPVARGHPAHKESGENDREIRQAALGPEGGAARAPREVLRDKAGGQRDYQSAPHPEQTAQQNQHKHAPGEEIPDAGGGIDDEADGEDGQLIAGVADAPRAKDEGDGHKIGQHVEELHLELGDVAEDFVELAQDGRDGQPGQIDCKGNRQNGDN